MAALWPYFGVLGIIIKYIAHTTASSATPIINASRTPRIDYKYVLLIVGTGAAAFTPGTDIHILLHITNTTVEDLRSSGIS